MQGKIISFILVIVGIFLNLVHGAIVEQTPLFEFHSAIWVNLHHFIRAEARQRIYDQSQTQTQSQTSIAEDSAWTDAINFYIQNLAQRDLLLDKSMPVIKNALEDAEDSPDLSNASLPEDLQKTLRSAAPIYKSEFWKEQDESNRKWIQEVSPLLLKFGAPISTKIAALYQTEWFSKPVRVDVTQSAGPVGAYTTVDDANGEPRVTISSYDPSIRGYYSLEILFHESSHAWGKMLFDSLEDSATRMNLMLPKQFWHLVLFYTAGEITRQELNSAGINIYVPYADKNDLYKNVCESCRDIIAREWQPYIEGKVDFKTAIDGLVAAAGTKN